MCIIRTNCESFTGKLIYSDQTYFSRCQNGHRPSLNQMANIPILGIVAGVIRATVAIFHMLGHLFAALCTRNSGHLAHVAKGGTEFLRGLLEAIPIVGRIFSWAYNGSVFITPMNYMSHDHNRCNIEVANWFLIKLYNPAKPDAVDKILIEKDRITAHFAK